MDDKREPAIPAPPFDENLRLHLGDKLKLLLAETAQAPIPDRFVALLNQLEGVGLQGAQTSARIAAEGVDDASEAKA